ncbi:hypothetical protein SAMN06265338_10812 [Rhodoblastus acidophilus]|uniref:Uncharacterized protein n=1 Tax=Rhodoblastus acidophilus TaxID=1074 RepID=A0A212RVP2_RHOAC|nr:hypothetical protein [Rhodoblastus acidophilus]PPQ35532.1 hypothetical protein CKO16_20420 [Rhodoblastus acidophilus]RAI18859.1 hypothetical protein CH337_13115 [Rhodoblastus acidophilus]SNB76754.1 hypothetical protein SAMN06265338_10812 [Rhodoblastus acidophilus]
MRPDKPPRWRMTLSYRGESGLKPASYEAADQDEVLDVFETDPNRDAVEFIDLVLLPRQPVAAPQPEQA